MKVLLAIDGSDHSHAAVEMLVSRHLYPGSDVRVICVVEPPVAYVGGGTDMRLYDLMNRGARDSARAAVDKAAAAIRADEGRRDCRVTAEVLSGSPKRVILQEAEAFGADLIMVGSHGHGMVERFLLGSVSQAVALHATCSVEIVRRRKTQTTERKES